MLLRVVGVFGHDSRIGGGGGGMGVVRLPPPQGNEPVLVRMIVVFVTRRDGTRPRGLGGGGGGGLGELIVRGGVAQLLGEGVDGVELPRPAHVVQERAQVEPVVVGRVALLG